MRYNVLYCYISLMVMVSILGCSKDNFSVDGNVNDDPVSQMPDTLDYSDVPQSDIYEVSVIRGDEKKELLVFKSTCPEFELGKDGMIENYQFPLEHFAGRSISWSNFSFSGGVIVEVKLLNQASVNIGGSIKIFPSRHGISPEVNGNIIRFTLNSPGQFSVEIGEEGYKNGLMIFADPEETSIPDPTADGYRVFDNNININSIEASYIGIYFKKGVYDIGAYSIPPNIKNIYFEKGSWVYGALLMDGDPNVKIFGRGVLSSAKLDYKKYHSIEAINQSDNIHLEGIVIADQRHFAVRLIGRGNTVRWVKTIGGWTFNADGIAAFANSTISNCFIWANDDAIKPYRDNTTISDCVVWQLDNGGVIQLGWTAPDATNITIQRIDILRTDWNQDRFNVGILNYVGNRYNEPGKTGFHKNWLIEDVFTETSVQSVINIAPDQYSRSILEGLTLRNWNVKMNIGGQFQNRIIGNNPDNHFKGIVFDNVVFNGIKLNESNWENVTDMTIQGIETPSFQ